VRVDTCGDTQGLVRKPVPPSSIDCNFMSQPTSKLRRAGPLSKEKEKS